MVKHTKPKTAYYKMALLPKELASLQEELTALLAEGEICHSVENRVYHPDSNSNLEMFINYHETSSGMLCGQFVRLESKQRQPLIKRSKGTKFHAVTMINPDQVFDNDGQDDTDESDNDFLEQIMYFCVYQNHLAVIQSRSVTSKHFEQYLNWLVKRFLRKEDMVLITDNPPDNIKNKFINGDIRKIHYATPVTVKVDSEHSTANHLVYERSIGARIVEMVSQAADGWLNQMNFEDVLNDMNMSVNVEIKYKRQTTSEGYKFLKELANANRHNYDDEFDIELKGGAKIKGDDFKVKEKLNVVVTEFGDINENLLYKEMATWLASKIS